MSWFPWSSAPKEPPTPLVTIGTADLASPDTVALSRDVERINELIRAHLEDTEKELRLRKLMRLQLVENMLASMIHTTATMLTLMNVHEAHETIQSADECKMCTDILRSLQRLRNEAVRYRLRYQVATMQNEDSEPNRQAVTDAARAISEVGDLCFLTFAHRPGATDMHTVKTKTIAQVGKAICDVIEILSTTKFEVRLIPATTDAN